MLPARCIQPAWTNGAREAERATRARPGCSRSDGTDRRPSPRGSRRRCARRARACSAARVSSSGASTALAATWRHLHRGLVELRQDARLHVEVRVLARSTRRRARRVVAAASVAPPGAKRRACTKHAHSDEDRRDDRPAARRHPLVADREDHGLDSYASSPGNAAPACTVEPAMGKVRPRALCSLGLIAASSPSSVATMRRSSRRRRPCATAGRCRSCRAWSTSRTPRTMASRSARSSGWRSTRGVASSSSSRWR